MMKKFYSLALILLTLFSCVVFSACGDKYKDLKINIFATDGLAVEERIFYILYKDNKLAELNIEFTGIDADELGQIVVYSLPNELITVTKYSYNGLKVKVEYELNMASGNDAKLIVSHLASGKKKEISLGIAQKSSGLTLQHSEYVVGIPKSENTIHTLNLKNVVNLLPNGSTDNIYFKIQDSSFGLQSRDIKPIQLEGFEGYEDVYTGFEIANTAADGEWATIYPVTHLPGYDLDPSSKTKYQNCLIRVKFKNLLDESNVELVSESFSDLNDIKLIANDDVLSSHKVSLRYLGLTDETGDDVPLNSEDLDFFDMYEIEIVSANDSLVSAFTDSNNDIILTAHAYTNKLIPVKIILKPINFVGDLKPVELNVSVKGELRSDNIKVVKNGESISTSQKIDIFNYYEEGNSLGSLFMFEATTSLGTVNDDLSKMSIVVDPSILSKENATGDLKGVNINSTLYSLQFYLYDRTIGNNVEILDFTYNSSLEKMVSNQPISSTSRVYIKYVKGGGEVESSDFGIQIKTTNRSNLANWEKVSPTTINLNFNRVEGVKEMELQVGSFEYDETQLKYLYNYLDCPSGYVYLNRSKGLSNLNEDVNPHFVDVVNSSVLGIDSQNIVSTTFTVKVQPITKVQQPLQIVNGRSEKDNSDGSINTLGSSEIIYNFDSKLTDDIISLVFRNNTSIGSYKIIFSQEGIEKASLICIVYEELTSVSDDMISFETNKKAFKNTEYNEFKADYIVASKQDLNISINLPSEVINSNIVTEYGFDFKLGIYDEEAGCVVESVQEETQYFNFRQDDLTFNNALLNFIKGTYIDKPQYVYLTITVFTKTYENIVTESTEKVPGHNYPSVTVSFYIYEEITKDSISINHTSMTRYYKEYLSVYYDDLSLAELKLEMNDELWHYVTTEQDILWMIDDESCVVINENQASHSYKLDFKANRYYSEYSRTVKAYVQQFENVIEFQCVFHVEKPILTERLIIESRVDVEEVSQTAYINLKEGDTYELKASNYSSVGNVSNQGIVIQVADRNGSAYNASTYINVDQTSSKITVNKVAGAKNLKLIVFAKDVLSDIVSSDKSGYNTPSLFIMNNLPEDEREKFEKAYYVIDIKLSDGSETNPYLIRNANEFWAMDDKEEHRTSYYQVMSSISLDNTTDVNDKTIANFKGTITTFDNNIYTFDGIRLNSDNLNVFSNFKGSISNIKFIVDYKYDIVDNSSWKSYYLGVFDSNGGTLTNIYVDVSGRVALDGSAKYYFGGLAGENNALIQYQLQDLDGDGQIDDGVVGVNGSISLSGNAEVYFGGLVGKNVSTILGCETAVKGGTNKIILSGAQGRSNAISLISIDESTLAGNSAIGGIVGLNTYYDDADDSLDTTGIIHNAFVQANINAVSTSNIGGAIGKNEQMSSSITVDLEDGKISSVTDVLIVDYIDKAIYNVKSASTINANNNVGGIVGLDLNGWYIECDYQVLTSASPQSPITAKENVGGLAGKSTNGKFAYCSVMSYKWDYSKLKTEKTQVVTSDVADIFGENNVGGLVGYASSKSYVGGGFAGGNLSQSLVVIYSSVNGCLSSNSFVGGILSTSDGTPILFNIYFIGKLSGTYTQDSYNLVLDSNNISFYNFAYSFNIDIDLVPQTMKDNSVFDINTISSNYWWNNQNINGGYIFITTDKTPNADSLPIFDLAPNSISATVKDEANTYLSRVLKLYYYDFSVDSSLTEDEVLNFKQEYNTKNLLNLVNVVAEPNNLGTVVVNVKSTNTTILDVTFDGRIIINSVGECDLIFSSALNPNAGKIENRTIKVVIDYPIGNEFKIRNNVGVVSGTENIAKDTTRQYYVVTSGYAEKLQADGSTKTIHFRTKTNVCLKVEIAHETLNPKDYISVTGEQDTTNSTNTKLVMRLDEKTTFMISALKKLDEGVFNVKVTPYRVITNADGVEVVDEYAYSTSFDVMTLVGITNVSFSYDEAIVYPNDTVYLTMNLTTDKPLCANANGTINVADLELLINQLMESAISGVSDLLFNVFKSNSNILYNVYCDKSSYDAEKLIQTVTLRVEFNEMNLTSEETLKFEPKVKNSDGSYEVLDGVTYSIIPQRINKIEIKNYYYQNEYDEHGVITSQKLIQQDVLKPNNYGKILIDIVPNNGYYDYLEISDITGDEEIVFIQVDQDDNALSLTYDPSSDGKGIKLYHYSGQDKSRIYVRTQISNEYSSKLHTIQVRAYSSGDKLLSSFEKYIDVKMMPEIKATYLLPNGKDSTEIASNEKNFDKDITAYLANGVDAYFRIETKNANSEIEFSLSGDAKSNYEFIQDVDNFYVLKSKMRDVNNLGKKIKLTLKVYAYMDNGEFDVAECSIEFTIVEFVVHSVSVAGSVNNEISGYFGRSVELEFYFDKYDVSFYDTETTSDNPFWDTQYEYGENTPEHLNKILEVLNSYETDGSNKYLILNNNIKSNGKYNIVSSDKIVINNNILTIQDGYNKEVINEGEKNEQIIDAPKYLAVAFRLYYALDEWNIETYQGSTEATMQFVVENNYYLNFRKATKWYEPTVINDVDEFVSMSSGGNYILNADLVLEDYVPLNVDLVQFDGNGHTIEIKSFGSFDDASLKAGLFAQIYENMIVKNVKVVYTSYNNKTKGWTFGRVDGNNNAITYADLCNNSTVNYTDAKFGGISAINNGIITNCVVEGQIAVHTSTLESRSVLGVGDYEVAFNIGGLVAENAERGYITNSISKLNIFAQANIGGFVHTNLGKIVSSGVEEKTTIYGYNVNLGNTINVKIAGFAVDNSGEISMSYVKLKHGENAIDSIYYGTMSAKDISAGFVYSNSGSIYDTYVQMSLTGINSNIFAGFVYSNSGSIERAYSFVNGGVKGNNNESMFAPAGTLNLNNCAEIVNVGSGYSNGIVRGLTTVNVGDRFKKASYEELTFAFGDNKSAVWKMSNSSIPTLVSTSEFMFEEFMPAQIKSKIELVDGVEKITYDYSLMFAGYGTKQNPYIVHDLESWNNYFDEDLAGKTSYYRIVKDIDFSSIGGNPSTSTQTFSGNIQGNNMKLSNIMLYSNENLNSIGLFEKLEGVKTKNIDNAVRNLTLSASSVWASSTRMVGVLAGMIENFNIYNITIDSPNVIMVGGNAVGGVAGLILGEFDLDKLSSNIGASSTRASTLYNYSIYMSKSNKKNEAYNLGDVYYAGSVAGILDGYGLNFNVDDARYVNKNYFKVRNVSVNGNVTISGDTVGGAFGFVGEQVRVENMKIDISGSIFGSEYSAGAIGENRGIISKAEVTLADNIFNKSKNVSSGAIGFNLGGLVIDIKVLQARIIKSEHLHTVAGIVGRNVYGTIANARFDGELFGHFTGGIVGANYDQTTLSKRTTGSGAISLECISNKYLIPSEDVKYYENLNMINNLSNVSLGKSTLEYLVGNLYKYYTYAINDEVPTLAGKTIEVRVLGLVVGLSYKDSDIVSKTGDTYNISLTNDMITFNSISTIGVTYKEQVTDVILSNSGAEVKHEFTNVNVMNLSTGSNYVMYLVGAKATSFDSWSNYSETEYLLVQ